MESRIEGQMVRLREEAAERAARTGEGGFVVPADRMAALAPHIGTFDGFVRLCAGFGGAIESLSVVLESVFAGAGSLGASDIHFEPEESRVKVRIRIDGILRDAGFMPAPLYARVLSRLKLLARMKLNASQPQDGRFNIALGTRALKARTSTIPSQHGETLVVRLLDPEQSRASFEQLGLRPDLAGPLAEALALPNGCVLVAGPTGSGKTTTLYAFIAKRARPEIKTITIEDPIEYELPGVEQTQVDAAAGYSFATGLKAIVRQDPDVILVGEIRDGETASIAMQAALTGHLVFTTLHANDAIGALARLVDLGVDHATIDPALNVVVAERLVRTLCSCKVSVPVTDAFRARAEALMSALPFSARLDPSAITLFAPRGCAQCGSAGYKGRIGIFEVLYVHGAIGERITARAPEADIRAVAHEAGFVSLLHDGVLKALRGITTLAEVESVAGKTGLADNPALL